MIVTNHVIVTAAQLQDLLRFPNELHPEYARGGYTLVKPLLSEEDIVDNKDGTLTVRIRLRKEEEE